MDHLPVEILAKIFSYLPCEEVIALQKVSAHWESVSRRSEIWKRTEYSPAPNASPETIQTILEMTYNLKEVRCTTELSISVLKYVIDRNRATLKNVMFRVEDCEEMCPEKPECKIFWNRVINETSIENLTLLCTEFITDVRRLAYQPNDSKFRLCCLFPLRMFHSEGFYIPSFEADSQVCPCLRKDELLKELDYSFKHFVKKCLFDDLPFGVHGNTEVLDDFSHEYQTYFRFSHVTPVISGSSSGESRDFYLKHYPIRISVERDCKNTNHMSYIQVEVGVSIGSVSVNRKRTEIVE